MLMGERLLRLEIVVEIKKIHVILFRKTFGLIKKIVVITDFLSCIISLLSSNAKVVSGSDVVVLLNCDTEYKQN